MINKKNKKKNNKKKIVKNQKLYNIRKRKKMLIYLIFFLILVIIICFICVILLKNKPKGNGLVEIRPDVYIKSSGSNKIEKNGVEASEILVEHYNNNLKVSTTLINHNKENINGFLISVELLDKDGNVITSFVKNSKDIIKAGKKYYLENWITGFKDIGYVSNARIKNLEINGVLSDIDLPDELK